LCHARGREQTNLQLQNNRQTSALLDARANY
jgi:hypothetical protein